jgi:hypothetical protein
VIVIFGTIISMLLELTGGRANWDSGNTFFGSVFSIEYIRRMYESAKYLLSNILFLNPLIVALLIFIIGISIILWFLNMKKKTAPSMIISVIVCFFSGVCVFVFNIALSAKAGPFLGVYIDYAYGPYFYIILYISLAILYIIKNSSPAQMIFPLITIFIILTAIDSKWPYTDSFYGYPQGDIYGRTAVKSTLINSYIEQIIDADINDEPSVSLTVPKYSTDNNWPIPLWWADSLSDTLYNHRIITKKIEIILVIDENIPEP